MPSEWQTNGRVVIQHRECHIPDKSLLSECGLWTNGADSHLPALSERKRDCWSTMRTIRVLSSLFVALENMELYFRHARDALLEFPLMVMRERRMLREASLKRRNRL